MDLNPWLIIAAITATIIGLAVASLIYEKKRRRKLAEIADSLGLQFQQKSAVDQEMELGAFDLLQRGRHRRCSNAISGAVEGVSVALFEYQYTTGAGKQQTTHRQTVAAFGSTQANLPAFQLEREHLLHKFGQVFGGKDIDFDDYPQFSKRYLLRGADEQAIRQLFTNDVIQFFEQLDEKWNIEAAGDRMIVYQRGKRLKPDRYPDFLKKSWDVLLTFPAV